MLHLCMGIYVYIYIYICMHTHTKEKHTHTHTHTHTRARARVIVHPPAACIHPERVETTSSEIALTCLSCHNIYIYI